MWDPQWEIFSCAHRAVRYDVAGFGRSPLAPGRYSNAGDLIALLEELGLASASLVGVSLGGRIALELAIARPDLLDALVLVGAGLPGHSWSPEVRAYQAEEDAALERGDIDTAIEANVRMERPAEFDEVVLSFLAGLR